VNKINKIEETFNQSKHKDEMEGSNTYCWAFDPRRQIFEG
jgi:hypothetical protein